jgi:hypothetical protein
MSILEIQGKKIESSRDEPLNDNLIILLERSLLMLQGSLIRWEGDLGFKQGIDLGIGLDASFAVRRENCFDRKSTLGSSIEILPDELLKNLKEALAFAASSSRLCLTHCFLARSKMNPEPAIRLLLQVKGHCADWRSNQHVSQGDKGQIYATTVCEKDSTSLEFVHIKTDGYSLTSENKSNLED